MESLGYAFEGTARLFTDDTDFQVSGLVRNRNPSKKWDGEDDVDSMGFIEPLMPGMAKKLFLGNQCVQSSCDVTNDRPGKSIHSASTITLNSLMEFGSRNSSCVNKANDEEFGAPRESNGNLFSMDNSLLSNPDPLVSAKRAKIMNSQSPVPTCQVHGCNKDLNSSKDYHKRHKVCDVHSKTAVVIVNGTQQRFCQQCSRFHRLAEFDEGKRSCRKRLAGHNERRRKSQFDTHLGSTCFTTDASKTSLIFSRILPGSFFGMQCNEPTNSSRHLKLEEEPSLISQLAVDVKSGQSLPKSVLHFHGKEYPSKNCLSTPLSILGYTLGSDSGCALSLLSPQSQNLSSNSAGISVAHPLISKENHHTNFFTNQSSARPSGESTFEKFTPIIYDSSGVELERLPVFPNARSHNALPQDPDALNLKSYLYPENANTVNLLELSLHLQRVEEHKHYGQIKLENGIFCNSTLT